MRRKIGLIGCALVLAAFVPGCAIVELKKEVKDSETRVTDKEAELARQQDTQKSLAAQRDSLLKDLRTRQLTATELRTRLDQMRKLNASSPAVTPEDRKRKDDRSRLLTDATKQADALEKDPSLSQQEKAKQLEALRTKTAEMLKLLLVL